MLKPNGVSKPDIMVQMSVTVDASDRWNSDSEHVV